MKKNMFCSFAALAAVCLCASNASAAKIHFSAVPAQSTITLKVTALSLVSASSVATVSDNWTSSTLGGPAGYDPAGPEGNYSSDISYAVGDFTGGLDFRIVQDTGSGNITSLSPVAGEIDMTNIAMSISVLGNTVDIAGFNLGLSLSNPSNLTFSPTISGNPATFDLAGSVLSLDQGVLTYKGTGSLASDLTGTFDLNAEGIPLALPANSTAKVQTSGTSVTLTIPLNVLTTLVTDPNVTAQITGNLVLTGIIVPEPGTLFLLGLAGVGLVPFVRRRFRRKAA